MGGNLTLWLWSKELRDMCLYEIYKVTAKELMAVGQFKCPQLYKFSTTFLNS